MEVKHNVFAHSDQWAGIFNGVLSPGAMLQNATGLTASENTYGLLVRTAVSSSKS